MFELSKREINVLTIGGVFLIGFVALQFLYFPMMKKKENLEKILTRKKQALINMSKLQEQFRATADHSDDISQNLAGRSEDFSLFSFLDFSAQQSGVKTKVAYMKPLTRQKENSSYKISTVKVKLKEVYLKELVDFIHRVESSNNGVFITSLSLAKSGKEKNMLDAVIETETLVKGKSA